MKVLNFKMNRSDDKVPFLVGCGIRGLDPRSCFGLHGNQSPDKSSLAAKFVGALVFGITVLWYV